MRPVRQTTLSGTRHREGAAKIEAIAAQSPEPPATCDAVKFAAGSLETELAAIGKAVPASEWAKTPVDYFANLDHYLHGAPKKK